MAGFGSSSREVCEFGIPLPRAVEGSNSVTVMRADILSLSPDQIVFICIVTVLGFSLRGGTGFGAMAAMPLLGLVVPMKILVPAWTVLSLCGSALILGRDNRNIAWDSLLRLLPSSMLGILLGLFFFKFLDSPTLARGLGTVAVVYGVISLRASMFATQEEQISAWTNPRVVGLLSGAIGTTFGALASLPIAMHFDAIRMPKDCFRATMSMILVLIGLVRGLGYFAVGEFRHEVLLVLLFTLPMALIGIFFGDRLQTGMSDIAFGRLVSGSLVISGFALLVVG
jgi:uncharacterized membrane protein YfcA